METGSQLSWGARAALSDRATWLVLAGALGLRLAVFALAVGHPENRLKPDSHVYLGVARTLVAAGEFSEKPGGAPEFQRPPGYSVFLAPFAAAWKSPAAPAALAQILLDLATLLAVVLLCAGRLGRGPSLAAGILYAAALDAATSANLVLSETLFSLMLIGVLALAFDLSRPEQFGRRLKLGAAAGFLLGLAVLVRVIAAPLAIPLAVLAALRGTVRQRLACAAVVLAAFAIPTGSWAARNCAAGAGWRLSTVAGHNWLIFDAAGLLAERQNHPVAEVRQELAAEASARAAASGRSGPAGLADAERELAIEILKQHPGQATLRALRGSAISMLPATSDLLELAGASHGERGTLDVLQREGFRAAFRHYFAGQSGGRSAFRAALLVASALFALGLLAIYTLAVRGTWRLARARDFLPLAILAVPVAWLLLAPGSAGYPRFHVPALAPLCLLAAHGWIRR